MNTVSKALLSIHAVWLIFGIIYAVLDHRGATPGWMRMPDYVFPIQVALAICIPIIVLAIGYVTRYPNTEDRTIAHGAFTLLQLFGAFLPLIS
jgi:hypothetical protein